MMEEKLRQWRGASWALSSDDLCVPVPVPAGPLVRKDVEYFCDTVEVWAHLVWSLLVSEVQPLQDVLAATLPSSSTRDFVLLVGSFGTAPCGC